MHSALKRLYSNVMDDADDVVQEAAPNFTSQSQPIDTSNALGYAPS